MTTIHPNFYTTVWLSNNTLPFINVYGHWDRFKAEIDSLPSRFAIGDIMYGFDQHRSNKVLSVLEKHGQCTGRIWTLVSDQLYEKQIHEIYPHIKFEFDVEIVERYMGPSRIPLKHEYPCHPAIDFRSFLCSFNGSSCVSRRLLLAALKKFQWYNPCYVSKNPVWAPADIDGHIKDYVGKRDSFYRKFFDVDDDNFAASKNTFGPKMTNSFGYERGRHSDNIYNLEHKLTQCFVHVVSESVATSYVPYVTEKAFYSIITRGLFVAYAQPGWHRYMSKVLGFRLYDILFDYQFDEIENPVERLIALLSMLSKFANLSVNDWHDLYQLQSDDIEHNYNHFQSGEYIRCIDKYHQDHIYFLRD